VSWWIVAGVAVGAYLLKAAGVFGLSRARPGPVSEAALALVPAALLAALVTAQLLTDGSTSELITRSLGVSVGGVLVWRRAPLVLVILASAATTALARFVAG